MSLTTLRDQVARLQTEIADLRGQRSQILDQRAFTQQDLASIKRWPDSRGHTFGLDHQLSFIEEQLMDVEKLLMKKQDDLDRVQLSWGEHLSRLPEKIVVLFFAANPLGQPPLRLDEEARAIADMIRKAEHRDAVKLESCWAVRPLDLLQAISEHKPRIVHFSAHGSTDEELVLQDSAGRPQCVSKAAIVQTLQAAGGDLQFVFFNACYSKAQAQAVVQHVQAAVGMNTAIGDSAARVFAAQFYSSIGFGHSVKRAFDTAKAALMLEKIPEENTPELFVADGIVADDLILVRPPDAAAKARVG